MVLAVDTRLIRGKNYVHLRGGREQTDIQTEDWIREAQDRGAGEILLTSMDHDGTKNGFDTKLLSEINQSLTIPLIASGGAGDVSHFVDVFEQAEVDAALAASVFHYGTISIPNLKETLSAHGITVR